MHVTQVSPSYETELGHAPTAVLGEVSKLTHVFGSPGTAAMDGTLTAAFEAKGTHAANSTKGAVLAQHQATNSQERGKKPKLRT